MTPERYVHTYPDYRIADSDDDIDVAPFDLTVAAVDPQEEAELLGHFQPLAKDSLQKTVLAVAKGLTEERLPPTAETSRQANYVTVIFIIS